MTSARDTGTRLRSTQRNEALERGLAQLRKATEFATGYQPQLVSRAEASAVLDQIEGLRGLLGRAAAWVKDAAEEAALEAEGSATEELAYALLRDVNEALR